MALTGKTLAGETQKLILVIVYDDGAMSFNGRLFELDTRASIENAAQYVRGMSFTGALYRVPGASGELLCPDTIISKAELVECIREQEENLAPEVKR